MRKYAAVLVVVLLMAAAFFLPEWLSALHDRQLLDTPSIQIQDEDREGFAESVQLTIAEKVLLLRGGGLTAMELSRETVEGVSVAIAGGAETSTVVTSGELAILKMDTEEERSAYNEEISQLWDARLAAARQEVLNLQALGGLPMLWSDDSELSYTGYGELLYMDPNTRMNFQVYRITLSCEPYLLGLMVDVHSGRILSFSLQWGRGESLSWGSQGAATFGAVWRNYWGLDSVGSGWYDNYTKSILEQPEIASRSDGQISFTYDGQSFSVPLGCMSSGGRTFAINWNC